MRKLLDKALPDVIDAGVDFWAYGVMMLEYYCPEFCNTLEITPLMQQVMEKDAAGESKAWSRLLWARDRAPTGTLIPRYVR